MKRNLFLGASASLLAASASIPSVAADNCIPDLNPAYKTLEAFLSFLKTRNATQYAITSTHGIDDGHYVSIGGIYQWISIRGWDRRNPVLLFLHGGPGDPTYPWSFMYFASWEKHFTIVQWDQRGAGRTLQKNGLGIASTITFDRMVRDGIELSQYLCEKLSTRKIVILGHSFGSVLGILMARMKPEMFYAYVGTGHVANTARSYAVNYGGLLQKAEALGNQQAVDELRKVGPPPYSSGNGYRMQWKWSTIFEGADKFLAGNIGRTLVAPGGTIQDVNNDADGMLLSADKLVPQSAAYQPQDLSLAFSIPIMVIQGAEDFTTATSLAQAYVNSITAPYKAFVTIPNGGHFAVFIHSDEFLASLLNLVQPFVPENST